MALIAAAPELYEALEKAEAALVKCRQNEIEACEEIGYSEGELPEGAFDHIDIPLATIRAAISRANGGER